MSFLWAYDYKVLGMEAYQCCLFVLLRGIPPAREIGVVMWILGYTGSCDVCMRHIENESIYQGEERLRDMKVCYTCLDLFYWDRTLEFLNRLEW